MMLKRILVFYFLLVWGVVSGQDSLVLQQARELNRPIVAVFLGGQECPWSLKLQQEVLQNSLFNEHIGSEAILWQTEAPEQLEKYHVTACPTILLLDPQGKEFARIDYMPGDAESYSYKVLGLISDFQELCLAVVNKDATYKEEKWQELYQKARQFSSPYFTRVILGHGFKHEKGLFFHLEQLAALLERHRIKDPEVQKLKNELLTKLDPHNLQGTYFKVAVLEFHKKLSHLKSKDPFDKPLTPLLRFIRRFEGIDLENVWKAQLMVAEYYFKKNVMQPALEYARSAHESAPAASKIQIQEMIAFMEKTCH